MKELYDKRILAIIPARLESSRLPHKPLKLIAEKTLVQRVWECACSASMISQVYVATDSKIIEEEVKKFGGKAVLTDEDLSSGSQRVLQAAQRISLSCEHKPSNISLDSEDAMDSIKRNWDLVINIQGDMPFLPGCVIDNTIAFHLQNFDKFSITTIATPIESKDEFYSPHTVKVVKSESNMALYFSRASVPFLRDNCDPPIWTTKNGHRVYGFQHVGLYLFQPNALKVFASKEVSALEQIEKLEQLRAMERGERVGVFIVEDQDREVFQEVNVPDDLVKACSVALNR